MTTRLYVRTMRISRLTAFLIIRLSIILMLFMPLNTSYTTRFISPEYYLTVSTAIRMTIRLLSIYVKVPMRLTCTPAFVYRSRRFIMNITLKMNTRRICITRYRRIGLLSFNSKICSQRRRMMIVLLTIK